MKSKFNYAGVLASIFIAFLTLTVFARNQMTGPEGALMRFFSSVATDNVNGAIAAAGGSSGFELQLVGNALNNIFRSGAGYQVLEIRRVGAQAFATVQFIFPKRVERTVWALRRINRTWYVDLPATLRLDPYQQYYQTK